ncbi:MAG: hypothetical protein KJ964_00805 [Verrucomicrobia bacterium]|nr:hypothetical protein [Verrucomicrobiota bacterium]MBU1857603.1 hypothetical protein [Verrucomicrobiota bacterium]
MLEIMGKNIDIEKSELLYNEPISDKHFSANWTINSGDWQVQGEWLTGKNPANCPGMIFLKGDYPGNVMVDFEARTVLPCTHDIDFMWNGSWDKDKNQRGPAYVAGLEGWWTGKVGIEKSPDYKLTAATPLLDFAPGRTYHIQGGSIDGHCFIFVNGQLVLEVTDPNPIDSRRFTKVGFEAYCSHIQIRNVKVMRLAWHPVLLKYSPEF